MLYRNLQSQFRLYSINKILKQFQLMVGRSLIRFIRFCKVGKDTFHFQSGMFHDKFYKIQPFVIRSDTDPSHAGIHFDMHFGFLTGLCCGLCQFFHGIPAIHCRADLFPDHFLITIRKSISQDQDRFLHTGFPEDMCLLVGSCRIAEHKIHILQHSGNGNTAVSVTVRLYDRQYLRLRGNIFLHMDHILPNGIQIYFRPYSLVGIHLFL